MKYLLELSFSGTAYCGFQVQPNGNTVQAELGRASGKIFPGTCMITGCSRTDSGVHANQYMATLQVTSGGIPCERIPQAMNTYLPDDISVLSATIVPDYYSVRKSVLGKEYVYRIWNGKYKNPFEYDRALYYPGNLDTDKMNEAAAKFCGRHDFAAFMASGSEITDTVRTITECKVEREGQHILIHVSADGFLYNMVRIIVGTLLEVSEGKISPDDIIGIIESKNRDKAGRTAPAHGLYLNRVFMK